MKIALCIPVADQPKALFTRSAVDLVIATLRERPDVDLRQHMLHDCPRIEAARDILAVAAIRGRAEWLLWMDDDQTFPDDALLRLLAHDLPFVGVNCRKRDCAVSESSARRIVNREPLKTIGIEPKRAGIESVDIIGFGLVLIHGSVFRKTRAPWFQFTDVGEDGYFCEQAIKAGFIPHVDHALSMEVGHIAETVLRFPA